MIISLIAAMSPDRVIGREGKLPWHSPTDLAHFKSTTMGHTVVMGRKTFDSIGHPLPGRKTIVLSRTLNDLQGCVVARSLQDALSAAEGDEEVFVIGGEEVFREALPLCQRIYLTTVHGNFPGDVHFPILPAGFEELQREERPQLDPPLTFQVFEKVDHFHPDADTEDLRQKGQQAVQRQLYFLGRRCLEQTLAVESNPEAAADLALCQLKTGGDPEAALQLAEKALADDPENPVLHLKVGRVQILGGAKEKGLDTLRRGMQLGGGAEMGAELERCGTRRPAPITSLPRNHPMNRFLGKILHRLGLR
jgi:dihydrofolate reductase